MLQVHVLKSLMKISSHSIPTKGIMLDMKTKWRRRIFSVYTVAKFLTTLWTFFYATPTISSRTWCDCAGSSWSRGRRCPAPASTRAPCAAWSTPSLTSSHSRVTSEVRYVNGKVVNSLQLSQLSRQENGNAETLKLRLQKCLHFLHPQIVYSLLITFMIVIAGIHLLVNDLLIEEGIIPRIPSRQEFDLYFDREEDKTSSAASAENVK